MGLIGRGVSLAGRAVFRSPLQHRTSRQIQMRVRAVVASTSWRGGGTFQLRSGVAPRCALEPSPCMVSRSGRPCFNPAAVDDVRMAQAGAALQPRGFDRGVRTARGGLWHDSRVRNLLARADQTNNEKGLANHRAFLFRVISPLIGKSIVVSRLQREYRTRRHSAIGYISPIEMELKSSLTLSISSGEDQSILDQFAYSVQGLGRARRCG
jgi:hypothetical protein